jgi:MYXO-CTERM domain-containing protein
MPSKPDGVSCSDGTCVSGICTAPHAPASPHGCGCTIPGDARGGSLGVAVALLAIVGRRRYVRREGSRSCSERPIHPFRR